MVQFPVKDAETASKAFSTKPRGKCFTCANKSGLAFGHCNRDLGLYYAFFCVKCKQWFCGACYKTANPLRNVDESCPFPKCGPVTSPDQIQVHDWFPVKPTLLSMAATRSNPPSPPSSVVEPPATNITNAFMKSVNDIQNLYSELEKELNNTKALVNQIETYKAQAEMWESKYNNLKRKLDDLIKYDDFDPQL